MYFLNSSLTLFPHFAFFNTRNFSLSFFFCKEENGILNLKMKTKGRFEEIGKKPGGEGEGKGEGKREGEERERERERIIF